MPIRRYTTHNARVRIHPDGKATLAGLDYQDLRSVLTLAANYCYDRLKQAEEKQNEESIHYYKNKLHVLGMAETSMKSAISATHGKPRPLTIAQRRAAVKESRFVRELIDKMLAK